ncbi:Hypothetical predicted protein [Pelobates cultripes]|uniref:Uncharacterized protein n=1 Tax=Pelobates cultripes TaxID=61616 RepID=A0AAD1RDH0_PELCU|nr:Hypothetical predicted protein [Pelobates cultripes]
MHTSSSTETSPGHIPACKADIQNLLAEIKAYFSADIVLVHEDMGVMTARLLTLEEDDARKQCNLRVRGIPKSILDDKVPHYLHRMWNSMLSTTNAKTIHLDYQYRVPKSGYKGQGVPQQEMHPLTGLFR